MTDHKTTNEYDNSYKRENIYKNIPLLLLIFVYPSNTIFPEIYIIRDNSKYL